MCSTGGAVLTRGAGRGPSSFQTLVRALQARSGQYMSRRRRGGRRQELPAIASIQGFGCLTSRRGPGGPARLSCRRRGAAVVFGGAPKRAAGPERARENALLGRKGHGKGRCWTPWNGPHSGGGARESPLIELKRKRGTHAQQLFPHWRLWALRRSFPHHHHLARVQRGRRGGQGERLRGDGGGALPGQPHWFQAADRPGM